MVKYLAPIDPHVHLRGEEYSDINFMRLGFRDARRVGLSGIIEQPNPRPQLIDEKTIYERGKQADRYGEDIIHRVYIGLTNDLSQVRKALTLVMKSKREGGIIVADKEFYSQSTGNMGILDPEVQKRIWKMKGEMNYDGVSGGHHEHEDYFIGEFDPKHPISHSTRQNPESELIQVETQIRSAIDNKFRGVFYIVHASNPDTVSYIESVKQNTPFPIVVEMTWHHMFLNTDDYKIHGNRVKMNPPLRSPELQAKNLEHVLNGKVDLIGTDHAPHPLKRKDSEDPPSGIHELFFWTRGIELLRDLKINEKLLRKITFHNANDIFNLGISPREVDIEYDVELCNAYGYNAFSKFDN